MAIGQHLQPSSFEKVQLKCEEGTTIIHYFIAILNLSAKYHSSYWFMQKLDIYAEFLRYDDTKSNYLPNTSLATSEEDIIMSRYTK